MKIRNQLIINRHSFKVRIILIFSIITFILVGIFSRTGYFYTKKIYLVQLNEQTILLTRLIAADAKPELLDYIYNSENMAMSAAKHYQNYLAEQVAKMDISNAFIFNADLTIVSHSHDELEKRDRYPRLILNKARILKLRIGETFTSQPFKGKDQNYYMWCFYRLNEDYWLGIRENAEHLYKIEEISKLFWMIGLIGIVITIISGWFLSYTITKPINRLVNFSKKIGQGNYLEKAPGNIKGELAILVEALDKMRTNIRENQKEKEQMLAQIAHEIRNPLGGIELMTGLIKEDMLNHGLDTKYTKKILGEISVLKEQITAYLNYSRPVQANKSDVKIENVLEEVLSLLNYDPKDLAVNKNIEQPIVKFDPNHLKQILTNLIVNAISAMNGHGELTISSKQINRKFYLTISDTGPGIPEDEMNKIFQPFYTTREEGTGLGLAICRKLCEQNGFSLSVKNNKDIGCLFKMQCKD